IIAPTSVGIVSAAQVVSSSKYKGKVLVTGLGTPESMKKYVDNGVAPAFFLWNPADLGYLAAYAAVNYAPKKITGAEGQSFLAGGDGPLGRGSRRRTAGRGRPADRRDLPPGLTEAGAHPAPCRPGSRAG